ncbi:MAG: hypothetical protein IJS83_05655 [Acholeplasmatales bacterium]|nr:hypothetical protein [Acholeplasmatales bacterium]
MKKIITLIILLISFTLTSCDTPEVYDDGPTSNFTSETKNGTTPEPTSNENSSTSEETPRYEDNFEDDEDGTWIRIAG